MARDQVSRGNSNSEPLDPKLLSAQKILRDPRNAIGDKFNPKARYSLLNNRTDGKLLGERLNEGWVLVVEGVPGDGNSDMFTLISKVE